MQSKFLRRGGTFCTPHLDVLGQKPVLTENANDAYICQTAARYPPQLVRFSLVHILITVLQVLCALWDRTYSCAHLLYFSGLFISLAITLLGSMSTGLEGQSVAVCSRTIARTKLVALLHSLHLLAGQVAVELVEENYSVRLTSFVIHVFMQIYIYYLVIKRRGVVVASTSASCLLFFYRSYRLNSQLPAQFLLIAATLLTLVMCATESLLVQERNEFVGTWNLRQERNLYERLLGVLKDPVMIVDQGKLVYANATCVCKLNINSKNYQRRLLFFVSDTSETLLDAVNKAAGSKQSMIEGDYRYRTREMRQYKVYITPSFGHTESKTLAIVFRDLTEAMEIEEKKAKERYQTLMFYSIPHELRTPLNIVQGLFSYMKGMHELPAPVKRMLVEAKAWCRYLSNEIANILDYSQFSMDDFALHPTDANLGRVMHRVVKMVQRMLGGRREAVDIKLENRIDIGKDYCADSERFQQVLLNVLSCSLKRVNTGKIEVTGTAKDNVLEITVKDTSQSSSSVRLPTRPVLTPRYRTKEDKEIVSLRMMVSDNICKKMGGGLTVESNPPETVTTIRIPVSRPQGKSPTSRHTRCGSFEWSSGVDENVLPLRQLLPIMHFNHKSSDECVKAREVLKTEGNVGVPGSFSDMCADQRRGIFLVVDDVELNRFVIKTMLRRYGWEVHEASNGQEAVLCAEAIMRSNINRYFVIFMDIDMPVMNGVEATYRIRQKCGKVRPFIVATTAFTAEAERRNCASAGMNHFIPKPLTQERIREVLGMLD